MDDRTLVEVCQQVADAVDNSLSDVEDWTAPGGRPAQYAFDLVADAAALEVLAEADLGVLSEESGLHRPDAPLVAILDPVDGSTNASRRIPWYATSICVVDDSGARVAVVANLATKERFVAVRNEGAWKDGVPVGHSGCEELSRAVVALSGLPGRHLGWAQFRAFGAAALELCAVAEGVLDAFVVAPGAHLAPWDYAGAALVCAEAGAAICDVDERELMVPEPGARRSIAAAATPALLAEVRARGRSGARS